MEPWADNFPRIEFQTTEGLFDLHNNAILDEICVSLAGTSLVLRFRHAHDWRDIERVGRRVDLEFGAISDLRIVQAEDFDPRAAATLEGVVHEVEDGRSTFLIDIGDVTCTLSAQSVALRPR